MNKENNTPKLNTENTILTDNSELPEIFSSPDPVAVPKPEVEKDEETTNKPKSKLTIVMVVLLTIIFLACVAFYLFSKSVFTTENFIEESTNRISNLLNSNVSNDNQLIDLLNNDFKSNGRIKITTNAEELSFLNNVSLDFNIEMSINKEILGLEALLRQNDASLNGRLYINQKEMFIESEDILSRVLKTDLGENIFDNIKAALNSQEKQTSKEDVLYVINKTIEYAGIALKEANIETHNKVLSVEYVITLDNESQQRVSSKFKELINSDERTKKFFNTNTTESTSINDEYYDDFEVDNTIVITIKQNTITQSIEEFAIENSYTKLSGIKIGSNKYKITSDAEDSLEYYLTISTESIGIDIVEDGNNVMSASLVTNQDKFAFKFSTGEGQNFEVNITKDKITVNITMNETKIKGESTIRLEDEKSSTSGNLVITSNDTQTKIDFSVTTQYKENIVSKKSFENAMNINELTEDQILEIQNKLSEKLPQLEMFVANTTETQTY